MLIIEGDKMIDMTFLDKDKEYFITDIEVIDGKIVVTRADGSKSEEKFIEHNLGFYRNLMIKNANQYIGPYMDDIGKDSFMTYVKKYSAIIAGIVGLYFLYNFDIHIAIKIIISILVILGELAYFLFNQLYLSIIGIEAMECMATEYYLNNIDKFRYYDREHYTDGFIVPPEDISKYKLTEDMLKQIVEQIEIFKKDGFEDKDITLTYNKKM